MIKHPEHIEQVKVHNYLKEQGILHFSVENEANRSYAQSKRFHNAGGLNGVTDLIILLEDKIVFCEMKKCQKVLKSGKLSKLNMLKDEQLIFARKVKGFDYSHWMVAYGFDDFMLQYNDLTN